MLANVFLVGALVAALGVTPLDARSGEDSTESLHRADNGGTSSHGLPPDGGQLAVLSPPILAKPSAASYPPLLEVKVFGTVRLELVIDVQGRVEAVEVLSSPHDELSKAAVAAAHGLQFLPAQFDGEPVSVRMQFTYEFVAPQPEPPSGSLIGEVREKGTRRPLAGATISHDGGVIAETGADGLFTARLVPGPYQLTLSAAGHIGRTVREEIRPGETVEVVYRLEPIVANPYETVVQGEKERTEVTRVSLVEQELREVPGTMGDPFRVVMLLPGVSNLASGLAYPVVRGAQPAATGYFLDGVRVPALFHAVLGPAVVHPDFVDGMDFYPGVLPARFGRVLGGVVDARVSRPHDDRLHASAYADLINAGAYLECPIAQTGTKVSLSGRFSYTGWLFSQLTRLGQPSGGQSITSSPVADLYDYQARVEQKVPGGKVRLLALGSLDVIGAENPDPNRQDLHFLTTFHRVDLAYRPRLRLGDAEIGVTLGTDRMAATSDEGPEAQRMHSELGLDSTTLAARATLTGKPRTDLTISVGADVDHRRSHLSSTSSQAVQEGGPVTGKPTIGTFIGGFAEANWVPGEAVMLTGGVRADNYHLVAGINHAVLEPRLSARWRTTDTVTLKAGAALLHQPPTVLLNVPVMDIAGLRYGLQESLSFDAGLEWRPFGQFEVNVDAYYSRLTRAIELDLSDFLNAFHRPEWLTRDPTTTGRAYGIEVMVRHRLGQNWFGWVSYSLQRSLRRVDYFRLDAAGNPVELVTGELPFAFDQTHVLNAAMSFQLPYGITVGASLHFNTGRPESGQISSRTAQWVTNPLTGDSRWVSVSRDQIARLPPYYRLDLRAAKRWSFNDFTLEAYLDVANATLQSEVWGYEYTTPEPGSTEPRKLPIGFPVVLPMLGLKGAY